MILNILLLVFLVLYVSFFLICIIGWLVGRQQTAKDTRSVTRVSVVVVARNEAANIGNLLDDLLRQDYPRELMEIIVVDDHSEDETAAAVSCFSDKRIRLLHLSDHVPAEERVGSYKKRAIEWAVKQARGSIIALTDADCRLGPLWLRTMMSCQAARGAVMVCGPVDFRHDNTLLQRFLALDSLGLSAIGAATLAAGLPTTCNAANLLFLRQAFLAAGGYAGNVHRSSGDDVFLLHAFHAQKRGPLVWCGNENAIVTTTVATSWQEAIQQRRRWASKVGAVRSRYLQLILLAVGGFNALLLTAVLAFPFTPRHALMLLLAVASKLIVDFTFLFMVTKYFKRHRLMWLFLAAEVMHILLLAWIGMTAWWQPNTWKGRKIT